MESSVGSAVLRRQRAAYGLPDTQKSALLKAYKY